MLVAHQTFICSNSKTETLETECKICSKLTIKTLERHHLRRSGISIVNFEHISHLLLVSLFLIFNK